MKPMFGLVILIMCILIGVYVVGDYILPDVVCKTLPPVTDESHPGQYNSHLLSDICSGIPK